MSTVSTAPKKAVQSWHVGVGASAGMVLATAIAGDLGQLCQNPAFTQSLTAGNFMAMGLTVLEFFMSKFKAS